MGSGNDRDTLVYLAKVSEQAERYEEMVEYMKQVAKLNVDLTPEEKNLLYVGYKNVIDSRRASWRILSSIQQKEENDFKLKMIKDYLTKVESELSNICIDIVSVLDDHLIPSASDGESTVFFNKMKGDYYRYLAEFKSGNEKKEAANESLKAYEIATTMAKAKLPPSHPLRLGLALCFSVFYYEIMNSPKRACHLAQEALNEATLEIGSMNDESSDTTKNMNLLRDNLNMWIPNISEGDDDDDDVHKTHGSAKHGEGRDDAK